MNGNALIGMAVDESGSMQRVAAATREGIESFLADQREVDGECRLSMVMFNNRMRVVCAGEDVRNVGHVSYAPGGGTALLDAVGVTIHGMDKWLANHPDFDGSKLVVIWTDGFENASSQYTQAQVNALIDERQQQGWNFQFMGAGDGWRSAEMFSNIPVSNVHNFAATSAGFGQSYSGLSNSTTSLRSTGNYGGV